MTAPATLHAPITSPRSQRIEPVSPNTMMAARFVPRLTTLAVEEALRKE
jgi:hypothetical protein